MLGRLNETRFLSNMIRLAMRRAFDVLRLLTTCVARAVCFPVLCGLAWGCYVLACWHRVPAVDVDAFGRSLGFRLLHEDRHAAAELLLHPIESVRYVEFAFVRQHLPQRVGRCLDVSSPRLLALQIAHADSCDLTIANPDPVDLALTKQLLLAIPDAKVTFLGHGIDHLATEQFSAAFDTVWSISVIEHIAGVLDDSDAMKIMWGTLAPGGTLLVTVPIDRQFRCEYSPFAQYPTQPQQPDGTFFFQRFYDCESLVERLIRPLGCEPIAIRWFGERRQGCWNQYRSRCDAYGITPHVVDVAWMINGFREFTSWACMPGLGVAGLAFRKPLLQPSQSRLLRDQIGTS